jgi:hypothetical protein
MSRLHAGPPATGHRTQRPWARSPVVALPAGRPDVVRGQIAGLGDAPPGQAALGTAIRVAQRGSYRELLARRGAAVAAVRAYADLEFVNGGGTGSVAATSADPAVTEVTAGSGLYGPTLFDAYRAWRPTPAAFFACAVVRRPAPGLATVLGGGWIASGPAARTRLPTPWLPAGLKLVGTEGAGEVQTPLAGPAAARLRVGDRVWFRHAKAGELCEHVNELHLVDRDSVVATVAFVAQRARRGRPLFVADRRAARTGPLVTSGGHPASAAHPPAGGDIPGSVPSPGQHRHAVG